MRRVVRGFYAIAEAVRLCRPNVICAYPITPQTEIVENLAEMYANGELDAEYITAESEFAAASIVLGASAAGARVFTATSSQGLLLMTEVLFNAAGMRLPIVMVVANRSVSAPLSIWNDHQDSMTVRDAGIIQMHAENNQEAHDLIPLAYKVAEDKRVLLPFILNVDGFKLTHAYEPVDLLSQEVVDSFLPPYDPVVKLSTEKPVAMGCYAPPPYYMEFRVAMEYAMERAKKVMEEAFKEWSEIIGRDYGSHVSAEHCEDAEVVAIAMGSLVGLVRDVVEEMRKEGKKVGLLKIRTFRPFPAEEVREALKNANKVIIFERSLSIGSDPPVTLEVKSALFGSSSPEIHSVVIGLGGRDIPREQIVKVISEVYEGKVKPGKRYEGVKEFEEVIP
ncbi:pyruvate flavodoxin/ferredoxin oxidoreductase domain protein [Ferroglobus placidus DSM 10642]|uniref:Pyruvate flavodoxin/ferredoxin oxidoreductase domain protein n=1 Tax=Ferroglobus placidus (strain DSM 10642 / AEDII12DO) TaxID=589924 RepID=D3RX49_FERPA|nr:transketolase C-terminal domain-containing protein [Ferroglobus placidus]ADC65062.1 pyruvate flavodoxin/ferredoxin oxidoreductase domain protein [Ferroglobus placidus DSM 10642]